MKNGSKNTEDTPVGFGLYKSLYSLPTIYHEEHVDTPFWQHIKQRSLFLVIAIFDEQGRLLVFRDFSKQYGWELLGGSIDEYSLKNIYESAQILAKRILGINIYEVQPIAFAENIFRNQNETITHYGLALIARANGSIDSSSNTEWGFFKELPRNMFASNNDIANLATKIFKTKKYQPAIDEVISSQNAGFQYFLHRTIVHGLIGHLASRQLEKRILKTLTHLSQNTNFLLDVSCGDDDLVIKIANRELASKIICNDISIRHLDFLSKKNISTTTKSTLVFTNHDLLDMPFNEIFDVLICKNTLHHLRSDSEIALVLKKFKKIGKTIIIMDIEDPRHSSWISWLWNKYYVHFLNDQGANFLTHDRLNKLLSSVFSQKKYTITKIHTIKGTYLFAVIS